MESSGALIEMELLPIRLTSFATHIAQRLTALPLKSTMPEPLILSASFGK